MGWNRSYPIGRLIAQAAEAAGLSTNDLVSAAGYRNLAKGRRRLGHLLAGDPVARKYSEAVRAVLAVSADKWQSAWDATRSAIETEVEGRARFQFRPYIFVETAYPARRVPIFVRALTADRLQLDIPCSWQCLPAHRLIPLVARLVREHFAARGGEIPFHGQIVGYRLHVTYDHAVELNTQGAVVNPFACHRAEFAATLSVRRRKLPTSLVDDTVPRHGDGGSTDPNKYRGR